MVICVYINPTIDKTVYINELSIGGTNRPDRIVIDGAGKAINAAVVMKMLGVDVKVVGLLYDQDGIMIKERLDGEGVEYDFLEIHGNARSNTKIFDRKTQEMTEINESGSSIDTFVLEQVTQKIISMADEGDVVLLTGSLPPGCPDYYYAGIIRKMHEKGIRCALDADGETLRLGVRETPYMIKPNMNELNALTRTPVSGMRDIRNACAMLHEQGISLIAVSMGKDGAILSDGQRMIFAPGQNVEVLSTVGAGDSMIAGMIAKLDCDLETILRSGVAAATGSVTREGTQLCTEEMYDIYSLKIDITTI